MTPPLHIVLTTISYPSVLTAMADNARRFGRLDQVKVWVVADTATPPEGRTLCAQLSDAGLASEFLDLERQERWGRRFPDLYARIPMNNEVRRFIGMLHAFEDGCASLLSIDDDNWPGDEDYFGGHLTTGSPWADAVVGDASGWLNPCEYLEFDVRRPIYPRGFPLRARDHANRAQPRPPRPGARIGVTAGLWVGDPDVDAMTWLNGRVRSLAYTGPDRVVLEQSTWMPVNTQNTCFAREVIPAFPCVPMGWPVPGGRLERYADVWGGYLMQSLLPGTPFHVSFGRPLSEHRRNRHDFQADLRREFWGLVLTDWFVDSLRDGFRPAGDIHERLGQLGEFLGASALPSWAPPELAGFLANLAATLDAWSSACRRLS